MLRQSSVLPTDVLAVFDGLANQGGFVTGNFSPSRVLNIYDAIKNKINLKNGQTYDNSGLDKILDPDTAATLDLLLAEYRRMSPMSVQAIDAAISNKMKQISAISNEPAFQKELLGKLETDTIEDFILENHSNDIGIDTELLQWQLLLLNLITLKVKLTQKILSLNLKMLLKISLMQD